MSELFNKLLNFSLPVRYGLYLFLYLENKYLKESNSIYCNKMAMLVQLILILSSFQYTEK